MVKYLMYLNENKFREEEYITVFLNYKATNTLYVHICYCKNTYINVIYIFIFVAIESQSNNGLFPNFVEHSIYRNMIKTN
jgi:hypothetical protein